MKILFDEDVPRPFRRHLTGHNVTTVQEMGWAGVKNGMLLGLIGNQGFEVLVTCDQNLQYQQSLTGQNFAIVTLVVPNKRMNTLLLLAPTLLSLLPTVQPGIFYRVEIPQAKEPDSRS